MSDGGVVGPILQFVSGLIGSGGRSMQQTDNHQWVNSLLTGDSKQTQDQNSQEATTGTKTSVGRTVTNSTSATENTTDAGLVRFLKSITQQAQSNADDPSKTEGVVTGITNTLRDAMTTSFGRQNQAGLYGSSSAALINNDLTARASADAANAVLSYQTAQQNLAANTGLELGRLLSKSKTNATSVADTAGIVQDNSATAKTSTGVTQNQFTQKNSTDNHTVNAVTNSSRSGMLVSVVCTWMRKNGMLSSTKYALVTADFIVKPAYQQEAYHLVAAPLVRHLEKSEGFGLRSQLILSVFRARTDYICASKGYRKAKKTLWGWTSRVLVATVCFFPALYYLTKELLKGSSFKMGDA